MWKYANPNPRGKQVPDCVVRAIAIALGMDWYEVYDDLYRVGRREADMSSSDAVWGLYLKLNGARPFLLPENCPECVTIRAFCRMYPRGRYIIGTGGHAVAVIDGNYYDSWDSGNEIPSFFWRIE